MGEIHDSDSSSAAMRAYSWGVGLVGTGTMLAVTSRLRVAASGQAAEPPEWDVQHDLGHTPELTGGG